MSVVFVTGNAGKLRETNHILAPTGIELTSHKLDLEETQGTIEEVSIAKAKAAAKILNKPVLVEDTALGFAALKGLPGVYIKWFLDSLGHEGLNKMLAGFEDKSATAWCTFAYCGGPDEDVLLFQGTCEGTIVPPRGENNFGWNAVFEPKGYTETFAEMSEETKNAISHRFKALEKLKVFLAEKAEQSK
ncbi:YALI0B22924p [Yarrowia lipolytica CLIB122]|uniref:Inosine triphosphate pyrophosphatase n=2 Tax=Yarrowia lipolytica TaxID=4952 RepID=ITPA_YARLI|nr:YALI0B22924p [Yarrowia lipolytica CLIB122]Q6CDL9.1 RecName: Full=Inosine triphosphate pyrophosphatase; Short=ITPase; Short=Inosine triphosphatase; AltName: Full=Non-canonical purine NTP pyrophosphatase; AltName: Full=Non-standard purine NTP pyrophosphatase; AltName: Full=Nucleoside-triphosphate diphosphatase; AltName: Full=Nucleoside-triphosphate pyrophosphatase; Short=NTPase [Yarrowia lipolytica CLIB122]AOW02097.1 hypothetical protein YALI1_B29883g [Yarrowia lipolytica]KAB8283485.1 inosine t|eukprot:XP_501243.1 YALI0B22924p [Yarrowia lipolytica CLIB122]